MNETENIPKISIGLPVYNGEKFIRNRLDNILSQTFSNFELIISDNASTDSTTEICKEYAEKDSRIKYIRQSENIGAFENFKFVLKESFCDYFTWASIDDQWNKFFLEKNLFVLESDSNVIGCTSKCNQYGEKLETYTITKNENKVIELYKKFRRYFRKYGTVECKGTYEERIGHFLRNMSGQNIYSVFRSDCIKNSFPETPLMAWDAITVLNVLKYGEIHVIDEFLLNFYVGGFSSDGIRNLLRDIKFNKLKILFPTTGFIFWCLRNLGVKIFLKNIDVFLISMFVTNTHMTITEISKICKKNH